MKELKQFFDQLLKSPVLSDVNRDIIEVFLDKSEIQGDLMKELPGVKIAWKVLETFQTVSDQLFIKKAFNVLFELKDVPEQDRLAFMEELEDKDHSAVEKLFLVVDKIDDFTKAKIFGRLCQLRCNGRITMTELIKFSHMFQNALFPSLTYAVGMVMKLRSVSKDTSWQRISKKLVSTEFSVLEQYQLMVEEYNTHSESSKVTTPKSISAPYQPGEVYSSYNITPLGFKLIMIWDDLMKDIETSQYQPSTR